MFVSRCLSTVYHICEGGCLPDLRAASSQVHQRPCAHCQKGHVDVWERGWREIHLSTYAHPAGVRVWLAVMRTPLPCAFCIVMVLLDILFFTIPFFQQSSRCLYHETFECNQPCTRVLNLLIALKQDHRLPPIKIARPISNTSPPPMSMHQSPVVNVLVETEPTLEYYGQLRHESLQQLRAHNRFA